MQRLRPVWAVKMIVVLFFSSILFRCVSAANHSVGGTKGWDLGSDLQSWSLSTTFHTGDNLVFSYGPNHDVIEVNQRDFDACQIISPIHTHNDGETVVPLDEPGARYFICGTRGHCQLGHKVQVDVLSSNGNASTSSPAGSPSQDDPNRQRRRPPSPQRFRPPLPQPPSPPQHIGRSPPSPHCNLAEGPAPQPASASKIHNAMAGSVSYFYSLPLITMAIFS